MGGGHHHDVKSLFDVARQQLTNDEQRCSSASGSPPAIHEFDEAAVLMRRFDPEPPWTSEGHVEVRFEPHRLQAESDTPMSLVKKVFELEVSHVTVCDH